MQMQWLLAALMFMLQPAARDKAVVFVCEHGAAKSVVATAYFNKLAAERGLPFRATFRGTAPQDNLSVRAVEGLKADGVTVPMASRRRSAMRMLRMRRTFSPSAARFQRRPFDRASRPIGPTCRTIRDTGRCATRSCDT